MSTKPAPTKTTTTPDTAPQPSTFAEVTAPSGNAHDELAWHKEALARHAAKLSAVWQDIRDIARKTTGEDCGTEVLDWLVPALTELANSRTAAKPTDLSTRLRGLRCFGPDHFPLLEQAADEIERYHGGMLAALAAMPAAAPFDAKHLVDAVTAVMSKHGLIDHLTLGATERFCDELLATFEAAAKQGTALPSHDLTTVSHRPTERWRGMNPDLRDAINKLAMNDAVARAALHVGIGRGMSETDTLAHIVLDLAASKGQLEAERHQLAALSLPSKSDAKELTDERIYDIAASCEIGIGHNDHETSQRFEFARAILAAIATGKAAS